MTVKAITFDLDDTLWPLKPTLKRAEIETYQWLSENANAITDKYSLRDIAEFRFQLFSDNQEFQNQISKVRIATIKQLALLSDFSEQAATELAEQSFQVHYQLRQQVNCYEGVEELLLSLSDNYILGAISNGNADVSRTRIGQFFSFALSAEQLNSSKPDSVIFNSALTHIEEQLGQSISAEQVIHVGDDFHCDVVGAKRANFKAIWLDDQKTAAQNEALAKQLKRHTNPDTVDAKKAKENIKADAVIGDIKELPEALAIVLAN